MSELEDYCDELRDKQAEGYTALCASTATMLHLCLQKGVFTQQEYESALAVFTAKLDQGIAEVRDEVTERFDQLMRKQ